MRRTAKRVMEYECEICKARYTDQNEAQQCEKREIEPRLFREGDSVVGGEKHHCNHKRKEKNFFPVGRVKGIIGPEVMDEEYSLKWLGGKLLDKHVYLYLVEYLCFCGKPRSHLFYSVELSKK